MKKFKKVLFGIIIVFVALTVIGMIVGINSSKSDPKPAQEENKPAYSKTTLGKALELTEDQEAAMVDIFSQCGIGEITSVQQIQAKEEKTSYWMNDSETAFYKGGDYAIVVYVLNETKTVNEIYFHDETIYIDGQPTGRVSDFYVNSEDREKYRTSSEMLVNRLLNFPDTAKYPAISGWRFGLEDDVVIVQSSVTSQNAFGVKKTIEFQVKWENGNPISLIADGTEYIT